PLPEKSAPSAPAPSTSVASVAPPPPMPSASSAEAPRPTSLVLVALAQGNPRVHFGPHAALIEANQTYEIKGDLVTMNAHVLDDLARFSNPQSFAGKLDEDGVGGIFPDQLYIRVNAFTERGNTEHRVYRYVDRTWKEAASFGLYTEDITVAPLGPR